MSHLCLRRFLLVTLAAGVASESLNQTHLDMHASRRATAAGDYFTCIDEKAQEATTAMMPCMDHFSSAAADWPTTASSSSSSQVVWTWTCTSQVASALVSYGRCLCPIFGGSYAHGIADCAERYARGSFSIDRDQWVKSMSSSVSQMVSFLCEGLEFTCNGQSAETMFRLRKLVVTITVDTQTGLVTDYKAELEVAVAKAAGVEVTRVTVTFQGRRLSSSSTGSVATATIEHLPQSVATRAERGIQDRLASEVSASVPGGSLSSVRVDVQTQNVSLAEMGIDVASEAPHTHGTATLFSFILVPAAALTSVILGH